MHKYTTLAANDLDTRIYYLANVKCHTGSIH